MLARVDVCPLELVRKANGDADEIGAWMTPSQGKARLTVRARLCDHLQELGRRVHYRRRLLPCIAMR